MIAQQDCILTCRNPLAWCQGIQSIACKSAHHAPTASPLGTKTESNEGAAAHKLQRWGEAGLKVPIVTCALLAVDTPNKVKDTSAQTKLAEVQWV